MPLTKKKGNRLNKAACKRITYDLLEGRIQAEQIKSRPDGAVYRVHLSQESIILKVWNRPGLRGLLRRITGTSPAQKEIRASRIIQECGISAPELVGFCRISRGNSPWTEAVLFEDVGECVKAMHHIKNLVQEKKEEELSMFLESVIEMTNTLVVRNIVDPDHTFNNIVTTSDGKAVRLDFESAYRSFLPWFPPSVYGRMLGFLISSYVFATQPDIDRASDFSKKLISRTMPPKYVLRATQRYIDNTMALQKRRKGIDINLTLPDISIEK